MWIDIFGAQPQNCIPHVLSHREKPAFQGIWQRHIAGDKEKNPDKKIIVSIEPCDEEAGDLGLRKRRKAFYMHNKYKETGYRIKLGGMAQELLIWNGEFVKKELRSFLALYSNGMLWPKIWKEKKTGAIE